ncbi:unnamed protein product [Periconia digitata]|uniref:NACHT domain-containing protein n=1 Tax=Periconia digitata TaxID=1303443 RepID=A0A9W4XGA3_9PLEO|nr:unnamed protein product [Periconia digitata]
MNQNDRLDDLAKSVDEVRKTVRERLAAVATKIDLDQLANEIHDLASRCTQIAREQRFLISLHYSYMYSRVTNVARAHLKTFDWIFEPDCDVGFVEWLKNDDGIYWISGKPGSGKSTLMKYLYDHPKMLESLKHWAKGTELITASFFFWSIGTQMQRTQEGLLRSLIFSILKQCPDLISHVCPASWSFEQGEVFSEEFWTLDQLRITMSEIVLQQDTSSKFCFFIDGLDEYGGQQSELVETLSFLTSSQSIKICASSRPWNIFEDAYGNRPSRKLYLEQLTRGDIALFVRSKLEEHTRLAMLSLEDVGVDELVNDIVKRAQGVFLWVYLVLLSLCEGLTNGDDVSLLQDRLNLIPSDLEMFFRLILDSVEPVYKDKMAQTFQVVLHSNEPLTLITLSFLDQRDLGSRLLDPVTAMDSYEIFDRHNKTRRRINGRYKGLLEVMLVPSATAFTGYRVDFFHRTVHDFIRLNDMQKFLRSHLPEGFSAHKAICKDNLRAMLSNLMFHARMLEIETSASPTEILEEVQSTIEELYEVYRVRVCKNFMELAIQSGLQFYVCNRLIEEPREVRHYLSPFFRKLLRSLHISSPHRDQFSTIPDMIEFLLSQGVNPNHALGSSTTFGEYCLEIINPMEIPSEQLVQNSELIAQQYYVLTILLRYSADPNAHCTPYATIWETFLRNLHNKGRRKSDAHQKILFKIMQCLLAHGADLDATSRAEGTATRYTVPQVIRSAFLESRSQTLLRTFKSKHRQSRSCISFLAAFSGGMTRSAQFARKVLNMAWLWWNPPPRIILDEMPSDNIVDEVDGAVIRGLYTGERWLQDSGPERERYHD